MTEPSQLHWRASLDGTEVTVLAVRLELGCDAVPTAECLLTDEEGGPAPGSLMNVEAEIEVRREDAGSRFVFKGQIVEAELYGEGTNEPTLRAVIAPRVWRLSQRRDQRIFQEMSVPDIVRDVLERAGVTDQQWQLSESYEPRTYCVQHGETDLAFVERLLAEEGIFFAVEEDVVTFSDTDLGPIDGAAELAFRHAFGDHEADEVVKNVEQIQAVVSDRTCLRDYDFEKPDLTLEATAESEDEGEKTLEIYDMPGRFLKDDVGTRRAEVLLQSVQATRDQIHGETLSIRLRPGRRFSLTDHPYEPLNQELFVKAVTFRFGAQRWGQADVHEQGCSFEALPVAKGPYRPPRRPRAAVVAGLETAVVTGPSGAEIHPDAHGRVKAQLHWDRVGAGDDTSSCWMRAEQPILGEGLLTPRVGWEVAVRYAEGDPDAPVVAGRFYNAEKPPPYALPDHKTRTVIQTLTSPTDGTVNEIRFDDGKGAEEMFMNASKDMSVSAGNNSTESVGGSETRTIGANQKLEITGSAEATVGASQTVSIGANQKVGVSTFLIDEMGGGHDKSIGGNRNLTVGGDHKTSVSGASSLSVGGSQIDLVAGSVTEATLSGMSDTIGAALIEMTASDRSISVEGARTESVGAVKAVLSGGGRGVTVGGAMTHDVAGAVLVKCSGDLTDNSAGPLTDTAAGVQLVKATEVTFAAESLLSVVCGGSTLTITPGSITVAGATIKIDADAPGFGAIVKDN